MISPENPTIATTRFQPHSLRTGLLLFGGLAIALLAAAPWLSRTGAMDWASLALTKQVAWLIRLTGLQATVFNGNRIQLTQVDWEIVLECTAIGAMLTYASFLLVFPSSFRAKGIGLLIGLPMIHVANLARLLVIAWVEELLPAQAIYFHDYLWQVLFLIGVACMWFAWVNKVVGRV